ncbi:MAG: hypothetical protein BWY31_00025 [Lentisphaerae bacterium ADurb.Bin242]|nr:MAG: hypothetical protein BWY31_00025 [Lentisphaerae bacterium ADurb.Bin242]
MFIEKQSRQIILLLELEKRKKAIRETYRLEQGLSKQESRLRKQLCREEIKKLHREFMKENGADENFSLTGL